MNYNDYYARQAGGALPYFAGAQYQRGHGLAVTDGQSVQRSVAQRHAAHQERCRGFG